MTFTKHHDMNECPACLHYHRGSRCGEPITEDVYVSDSAFGGRKRLYRSMIVATCGCKHDQSVL